MSGHEEKTLQNTTVVIDKAKNCFSLSNQTKYSRTKMKYSCCFFSLLLEEVFMYFCKRNRDAKRKKKLSYILKDLVQYHVGSVSSAIIHQCTRNTSGRRQIQEVKKVKKKIDTTFFCSDYRIYASMSAIWLNQLIRNFITCKMYSIQQPIIMPIDPPIGSSLLLPIHKANIP